MPNKLRSTGILFAVVFVLGALLGVMLLLGRGEPLAQAVLHPYPLICLGMAALFAASAFVEALRWIQPVLFLAGGALVIVTPGESRNIYGLGFLVMSALLLERAGFFLSRRVMKVVAFGVVLFALELLGAFLSNLSPIEALAPTFFISAFGVFLWFLYKDRLVVILKEPKATLSLAEKGLSKAERTYVLEAASGKQQKEIAIDFEVAESTVRNTLARAYKKLGVEDKSGLATLAERFEIVG